MSTHTSARLALFPDTPFSQRQAGCDRHKTNQQTSDGKPPTTAITTPNSATSGDSNAKAQVVSNEET